MALPNDSNVPVGSTGKFLRTFVQTILAKLVHVEAMSLADPQDVDAVTQVMNTAPVGTEYGAVVRLVGNVNLGSSVEISNDSGNPIPVNGTVGINNFPATQAVTGTFFQATQPISGSVSVSNFPATQAVTGAFFQATQPVSGPLTDTQLRAAAVPVSGTFFQATQPVSGNVSVSNFPSAPGTGANTSVAGTTTNSTTVLAANASRKGATIYQDDTLVTGATLKVSLGATCTPTNFTAVIAPGGYYEVPFSYTGIISGVWSASTGNARVTQLT